MTGARRGTGLAIAEALSGAGADIVGVSNSAEPNGGAVRRGVEANGRQFHAIPTDLSIVMRQVGYSTICRRWSARSTS